MKPLRGIAVSFAFTAVATVFAGSLLSTPAWAQADTGVQPIAALELSKYLGRWYEIAKFPNRFQKKCVSDTSAEYSLLPEGGLRVVNQCRLQSGEMDLAVGAARQVGDATSPQLKVRFAPAWLSLLPFVWGDYWVVDLDPAYRLAAVSEPGREYLWILSRTPSVDAAQYAALLQRLTAMGLDVAKLEKTRQQKP